jgi:hypothetical protein
MGAVMAEIQIYADSVGPGRCRSCGASITWAEVVKSSKRMPFGGEIVTLKSQGSVLEGRVKAFVDTTVNPSHFSSCPQAASWRK